MHMNYLTATSLHRDARGRVRFSFRGNRYEVLPGGRVNMYTRGSPFGEMRVRPAPMLGPFEMENPDFLCTLAEAVTMQLDRDARSNLSIVMYESLA